MDKVRYKFNFHKWRLEKGFSVISNNKLELFFLNEISTDICSILKKGPKDIDETIDVMMSSCLYEVDKDTLYQDIEKLFECLLECELLEAF